MVKWYRVEGTGRISGTTFTLIPVIDNEYHRGSFLYHFKRLYLDANKRPDFKQHLDAKVKMLILR
jgi:hypothetical protein